MIEYIENIINLGSDQMLHLIKKFSILLILIIIPVALFGCGGGGSGGGGGGGNKTYTTLQPAGEQIVKDTQLVFESIEEIATKHDERFKNFGKNMQSVTRMLFICIDAIHLAIENEFNIEAEDIDFGYDDEEHGYVPLELKIEKEEEDEDSYNFTIDTDNESSPDLQYTFSAKFVNKSEITNLYKSIIISDIELKDDPDIMKLELPKQIVYNEAENKLTITGNLVYEFEDNKDDLLTLSLDKINLGQPNEKEARAGFKGEIYDDNITVNGSVYVAYNVGNSHPNECKIEGKIEDKKSDLFFDGNMKLTIGNTEFNPYGDEKPYSKDNWPQAAISFAGRMGKTNGNKVELKLEAKELVEFGHYQVNVEYKVVHTDKVSNISMDIKNETPLPADVPKVNFHIKSDWGPAEIKMQLAYDNDSEKIADASGDVYAHGKKVADITFENGLVLVKYEDGHKETF